MAGEMGTLDEVHVLVAEDEPVIAMALIELFESEGASAVHACDGAAAFTAVATTTPDLLVFDLGLPDVGGVELLARFRAAKVDAPALAITTASAGSDEVRLARGRFDKVLRKPFHLDDLLIAAASLTVPLEARARLRDILAEANARTSYRQTSLFRFDGDALTSVWSFDRERPGSDDFPLDAKVDQSYCCYVRASGEPFVVQDAVIDPRVEGHSRRAVLRAYCGVPVRDASGVVVGALCHFDASPREAPADELAALEREARRIEQEVLAKLKGRGRVG